MSESIIRKLSALNKELDRLGHRNISSIIGLLYSFAGYEDWKHKIEELSQANTKPFNDWFGGEDRLYFPFKAPSGMLSPKDQEVIETLQESGYEVTDYVGGYAEKDGRKFKIGKLLEKFRREDIMRLAEELKNIQNENEKERKELAIEEIEEMWGEIIGNFRDSEVRRLKDTKELYVVISQNPHDLAKMSYERSWTSCMNLDGGEDTVDSLICEVQTGGLVAYLIRKDDPNIEKPISRIHIRRFSNGTKDIALTENEVYGVEYPGFKQFVDNWLKEKNEINLGVYSLMGGSYSDSFDDDKFVLPESEEDIIDWLRSDSKDEYTMKYFKIVDNLEDELLGTGFFYENDYAYLTKLDPYRVSFTRLNEAKTVKEHLERTQYKMLDIFKQKSPEEYEKIKDLDFKNRFEIRPEEMDYSSIIKFEIMDEITNKLMFNEGNFSDEVFKALDDFILNVVKGRYRMPEKLSRYWLYNPERINVEALRLLNPRALMEFYTYFQNNYSSSKDPGMIDKVKKIVSEILSEKQGTT